MLTSRAKLMDRNIAAGGVAVNHFFSLLLEPSRWKRVCSGELYIGLMQETLIMDKSIRFCF